ncbi:hypothetical protein LR002_01390, partial [Candidatus Gracilibacteria bacterium]|nr:hypothetical protein [Candidatus Gracilibacteria bacterium]
MKQIFFLLSFVFLFSFSSCEKSDLSFFDNGGFLAAINGSDTNSSEPVDQTTKNKQERGDLINQIVLNIDGKNGYKFGKGYNGVSEDDIRKGKIWESQLVYFNDTLIGSIYSRLDGIYIYSTDNTNSLLRSLTKYTKGDINFVYNFFPSFSNEGTDGENSNSIESLYGIYKNKWIRDCTEQDFKCVGADDDCKYGLGQNVGGCNFGCGEGNNVVVERKDKKGNKVICNEKSIIGQQAKENAVKQCLTIFYTGAVAGNSICVDENPSSTCEDGQEKVCMCGAGNRWELGAGLKLKVQC